MYHFLQNFGDFFTGLDTELLYNLLTTLAIIVGLSILRMVVIRFLIRKVHEAKTRYNWRKYTSYVFAVVGTILIADVWFGGLSDIGTFLGLLSAGIAIALKDPIANLAGWLYIVWRRPFHVGDRIELGDVAGDVIDLRIFQFTVMEIRNWVDADQYTGRMILMPNSKLFTMGLVNYSKGFKFVWNEHNVRITFESNWRKAKKILEEIVRRHAAEMQEYAERAVRMAMREYLIVDQNLDARVYTSVEDYGVRLTLRYPCDILKRRHSAMRVWEDVLEAFESEKDIQYAYPTTRFFDNTGEGKPGARENRGKFPGSGSSGNSSPGESD